MSAGYAFGAGPRDPLARAARPFCSECGGSIRWTRMGLLVWDLPPDERLRGLQILEHVGESADAYTCGRCGNWGAFETSQSSPH